MELREFKRILMQVMVVPMAALMVLGGVLVWQILNASKTVDLIGRSDRRIALAYLVERIVVDQETGLRGYQITHDPRFLDPYLQANERLPGAVRDLRATYSTGDSKSVDAFVSEHEEWIAHFAEPTIAAVRAGTNTNDVELNMTGRVHVDAMRKTISGIVAASDQRRTERVATWGKQRDATVYVLLMLAVGTGLFLALFTRNRLETVSMAFRRSLDLQKERSEELFRSEQHLRTTLASIGDGVIVCDHDGMIQMLNPVAQELTGWPQEEAIGRPVQQVFPLIDESKRTPVAGPIEEVQRLNQIVALRNHTLLVRRDGTELAIDDSGAPIRGADGTLHGVVLVFRDITHERRSRAALLANEKLAVAGRLAATIAHEIHNPLDSVSNVLYLLQDTTSETERSHFLEIAQQELARVTQISRAMLSLYRESKAPVAIDLKETMSDLLLLMDRRFQDLGVRVVSELPEHLVVEGFPAELRQVFTNLIVNAAEAAGTNGEVRIRVTPKPKGLSPERLPPGARPQSGALIEIFDSGPGIAPEVREQLFEPFFTTKGEHGTGLGLWVCKGIIRKHGGVLDLANRPNGEHRGAVATVFLSTRPTIEAGAA